MIDFERRAQLNAVMKSIGYSFTSVELLDEALTHTSFVKGDGYDCRHNERLEFLGDAVLELCVSEYLFRNYDGMNEGQMTRCRSLAVYEPALYRVAKAHGIGEGLRLGRGEDHSGGREKPSVLSDALEAIIGAVFMDGGIEPAKTFIMTFAPNVIRDAVDSTSTKDHKTLLQEYAQSRHMGQVKYSLVSESGPDHDKRFDICVSIGARELGTGHGRSKQEAGQEAARAALAALALTAQALTAQAKNNPKEQPENCV